MKSTYYKIENINDEGIWQKAVFFVISKSSKIEFPECYPGMDDNLKQLEINADQVNAFEEKNDFQREVAKLTFEQSANEIITSIINDKNFPLFSKNIKNVYFTRKRWGKEFDFSFGIASYCLDDEFKNYIKDVGNLENWFMNEPDLLDPCFYSNDVLRLSLVSSEQIAYILLNEKEQKEMSENGLKLLKMDFTEQTFLPHAIYELTAKK